MDVDLGDPVPLAVTITTPAGAPGDAGTVTCTVTLPDGSTAPALTVQHDGTGLYSATYTPTVAGLHVARWVATAPNAAAFVDVFTVTSDAPVVGMAELRAHLGVTTTTTDEQLRGYARVATDLAERYTGRTWRRGTVVETHDGGRCALILRQTPVASITSVTESGTVLTSGWVLDAAAGILHRGSTTSQQAWASGVQNVAVTYVVGGPVPDTVRHAVLELTRHLWDTQRGGSQLPRQQGATDDWDPRAGYSVPRRVAELLDAHRAPGIG